MPGVLDTANPTISPSCSPTPPNHGQLALVRTATQSPAVRGRTPNQQVIDAGPSLQRVAKVYASTAEAIANFKPTPREVISGIAPHVFDERKRRRSQKRGPKPYWYEPNGQKRSSPLRGATVISWDEHSIYLEQPDHKRVPSPERSEPPPGPDVQASRDSDVPDQNCSQRVIINKRRVKLDKSGWKYFRVDIHLLKSIGVKLKLGLAPSSTPSTKP